MSQDSFQNDALTEAEMSMLLKESALAGRVRARFPRNVYCGLDRTELQVLVTVGGLGVATPSTIGRSLCLERNALTRPIAKLTLEGLLVETSDDRDGRRKLLSLSEAGRAAARDFLQG